LWTNSIKRVAAPTQTTSTPVANGSSVPACPTFTPRNGRATQSTTAREVIPCGLSRLRVPEIRRFFTRIDTPFLLRQTTIPRLVPRHRRENSAGLEDQLHYRIIDLPFSGRIR